MSIEFFYPLNGSKTSSITLKDPDYGNSEIYDNNVLYHIGMNGTVFTYKKKLKQTLLLTFSALTKAKSEEFEAFFIANSGLELGYTDPIGTSWKARILNNPLESTVVIGRGACQLQSYTVQLKAVEIGDIPTEGTLIDDVGNYLVDDEGNYLVAI